MTDKQIKTYSEKVSEYWNLFNSEWTKDESDLPPAQLYHYTRLDTLLKIVQAGFDNPERFYFNNWRGTFLGSHEDQSEGLYGARTFLNYIEKIDKRQYGTIRHEELVKADWMFKNQYFLTSIISLTNSGCNKFMWNEYADKDAGVCLEINSNLLLKAKAKDVCFDGDDSRFWEVRYGEHSVQDLVDQIKPQLDKLLPSSAKSEHCNPGTRYLRTALHFAAHAYFGPRVKENKFSSEKEIRLITRHKDFDESILLSSGFNSESTPNRIKIQRDIAFDVTESLVTKIILGNKLKETFVFAQLSAILSKLPHAKDIPIVFHDEFLKSNAT